MSHQPDSPANRREPVTVTATATRLDQIEPVDATCCPLCGQSNQCAMAAGPDSQISNEPCWCVQESFPAALLASVPAAAQRKACICQRCLRKHANATA